MKVIANISIDPDVWLESRRQIKNISKFIESKLRERVGLSQSNSSTDVKKEIIKEEIKKKETKYQC